MALTQAEINSINAAFDGALSRFFKPSSKGNVAGSSNSNTNAQKRALENSTAKLNALSESADDVKKSFKTFKERFTRIDSVIESITRSLKNTYDKELIPATKKLSTAVAAIKLDKFGTLNEKAGFVGEAFDKVASSASSVSSGFAILNQRIGNTQHMIKAFGDQVSGFSAALSNPPSVQLTLSPQSITGLEDFVKNISNINLALPSFKGNIEGASYVLSNLIFELASTPQITGFSTVQNKLVNFGKAIGKVTGSLMAFKGFLNTNFASISTTSLVDLNTIVGKVNPKFDHLQKSLNKTILALQRFRNGLGGGSGGSGGGGSGGGSNDGPPQTDRERQQAANLAASKKTWEAIKGFGADAWIAIKRMGDDAYGTLAARGYGTTDAMPELYKDAMLAGMSLKEYAQFMDKNMIAISRASSFADFHKNLKVGTDGLKQFGVFGQDATNLAGTMMSTAVGMGVPQARLNDSIKAQTEAFAELRKGSNLTAEAFGQLISTIQDDEQLNRELANLSVDDRNARTKDIAISLGWAKQLGLSDNAIRSYTQAVLEHRKTTVKQRFEQAGRISQVGAMVGMGAEETDRMRVLAKNKYRTADEEKEFAILAGKMNSGLEKMQQGGPGSQFQSDIAREKLEQAGLGSALAGGTQINAGIAAGPTQNKDLNKKLSPGEQVIGESINTLAGAMKNPLAQLISVGASQLTAAWVGNGLLATIAGNGMLGGLSSILGKVGPVLGAVARIGTPIALAAGAIYGGYSSYQDYKKSDSDEAEGKEGAKEAKGKAKGEMYGTAAGAAVGVGIAAAVAAATGGIGLALSTSIISASSVVGRWLGGWIGGANAVETATEKLARELANNNKQLEKNTRATAGSSTVSADNLGNLTRNVAQTSKAFTAPTAAENKADFESKKTPEQKAADKAAAIAEYDRQMTLSTGFANGGKRVWEIEGKEKPVDPRTKGSITTPATTPQGVLPTNPMYKDTGFLKGDFFTKVTGATTAPTQTTTIATPPPVSQVKMGQDSDINKEKKKENVKTTETPPTSTSLQPNPVADASQILMQILEVLRSSLTAETMQAQLTEQLLRANALRPTLPDNQDMANRVFAQA